MRQVYKYLQINQEPSLDQINVGSLTDPMLPLVPQNVMSTNRLFIALRVVIAIGAQLVQMLYFSFYVTYMLFKTMCFGTNLLFILANVSVNSFQQSMIPKSRAKPIFHSGDLPKQWLQLQKKILDDIFSLSPFIYSMETLLCISRIGGN